MAPKKHIEKVAIVGAAGRVGRYLTSALLSTGRHSVTAITRHDSQHTPPAGCTVTRVDYISPASLTEALRGHDALIITMPSMSPASAQLALIDAAAAASVPWILPNEFGYDPVDQAAFVREAGLGPGLLEVRTYIEEKGVSGWLGIVCGFWYEFSLAGTESRFGFDFEKRKVTFFDQGRAKISVSTWEMCGKAVAALLSLPVEARREEKGHGIGLNTFKNKPVYVASFTVSQREMFESVKRVTETNDEDWEVKEEETGERLKDASKLRDAGEVVGYVKVLYTRSFVTEGDEERGAGWFRDLTANDALGLEAEDLDEATRRAVEIARMKGA